MITAKISIVLLCLFFYFEATLQAKERCKRTNKKAYRYCLDKTCRSQSDCGANEQCLCDGDCGLSCVRNGTDCRKPDTSKNVRIQFTKGTKFASVATFSCKGSQYTLRGSRKRVCRGIRKWDGKQAKCRILCKHPGDIAFGNNNGEKRFYRVGNTIGYWCFPGYEMEGRKVIECNKRGRWNASPPKCSAPSCSKPKPPDNAYVFSRKKLKEKYKFNEVVIFRCDHGYYASGSAFRRCLAKGWTASIFRCIPKSCGDPGTPSNGRRLGYVFTFKRKVYFKCDRGYKRVGPEYRQCQSNQKWSDRTPTCTPIVCDRLNETNYLEKIEETSVTFGGKVVFMCNKKGYELQGSKERVCGENGKWSGATTTCERVPCADPGSPQNGVRRPVNKRFQFEDRIDFQCNRNFTRSGDSFIMCEHDKTWSGTVPRCLDPCKDPGIPNGGHRRDHSFLHGYRVRFTCRRNWNMEGIHTIRCNNGRWDHDTPKCIEGCSSPGRLDNGNIYTNTKNFYRYRDRVRFYCYGGYKLVGNEYITCLNGDWNSDPPKCKRLCGNPGRPANGGFTGSEFFEGGEVRFYCNSGFDLIGSQTTRCLSTGRWSGRRPECKRPCFNLWIPSGGPTSNPPLTRGQRTKHGTTIRFSCRPRYTLEGQQTIRCENGRWSRTSIVPVCRAPCQDPYHIHNGRKKGSNYLHGERVTYSCLSAYTMEGSPVLTCNNGRWDRPKPSCNHACAGPGRLVNGDIYLNTKQSLYRHRDRVRFYCFPGYKLVGDEYNTCTNGTWSKSLPQCKRVCVNPGRPANGGFTGNNFFEGGELRFYCYSGFDLIGSQTTRCLSTGQWYGRRPECKRKCDNPRISSGGPASNPPLTWGQRTKHGTTIRFSCRRPRYTLEGQQTIRCEGGRWSHTIPVCKAPCADPGTIRYGIKERSNLTHGSQVTYRCLGLYILDGSSRITCKNGQWDRPKPSCKEPCSEPVTPVKGNKTGNDYRHGKRVDYTCQSGTTLVGQSSSICNNGEWSSAVPSCLDNCKNPGKPLNGSAVGSDFRHGQQVSFQCHVGFRIKGNRTSICNNGHWDSAPPTCVGVCPDFETPINGERLGNLFDYGAHVRFRCITGYDLRGPSILTCNNGEWSNKPPVCKASCPNPGIPSNGRRDGDDFKHLKSVDFFCNEGYGLIGAHTIRCNDGSWSPLIPTCEASCSDPGTSVGMTRQGNSFKSRSSVEYSCIPPLVIVGNSILTCKDGNWSHNLPSCSECGSPLGMENRKIPDSKITASSTWVQDHSAKEGRLNGPRAWCSGREMHPYLEIDFGKPYKITAVATQGSVYYNKWVGSYALQSNLARSSFTSYREDGNEKVFSANTDAKSAVKRTLRKHLVARKIRVYPIKPFSGFTTNPACMRVELYGCDLPLDCFMVGSRVVAKWLSANRGGYIYLKAYVTTISRRYWFVELENENHDGRYRIKRFHTYESLPFVLDVPAKHEELRVRTRVLAPWKHRYFTGTISRISKARDNTNNRYEVRADDGDYFIFTIDQIRLLKTPKACNI